MERTEEFDFGIFDAGRCFFDFDMPSFTGFHDTPDSVSWPAEDAILTPVFNFYDTCLLDPQNRPTSDYKQQVESWNTPLNFPSGGTEFESLCLNGPFAVEYNKDTQNKNTSPLWQHALSSSNLQTNLQLNREMIDLDVHDVYSSPPSLSMSSSLSSQSSSFSSHSCDSAPMTLRRRRSKPVKHLATRLSLPASSQQKREVLRNALIFQNRTPTADQTSFLAKCLHIDKSILQSWQDDLEIDEISSEQGKPLKAGRVATWKQIIIRRGLQKAKFPSACQIEFLAAGLRISVEQLWQSVREYLNTEEPRGAKRQGGIEPEVRSTIHLLRDPLPLVDNKVLAVESKIDPCTALEDSAVVPLLSRPSTVSADSSASLPRSFLMESETKPVSFLTIGDAKSQTVQHTPGIVCKIELGPDCNQLGEQNSRADTIHDTSNTDYHDTESIDDDDVTNLSPEEELEALLNPEYGHLAESFISKFATTSDWDQWSFASGSRQHTSGVGTTPTSSSSHTPGNTSSPNTLASGSSGGKRKSRGSGGGGGEDGEQNDDGNMDPPPLKKAKTTPMRYDCPIYRRSQVTGRKVGSCALNGLEFRNLWDHLRKAHYGCEICGLKLHVRRADKTHLLEREKNPSICNMDLRKGATFDIDMDTFAGLEDIYYDLSLSIEDKWKKWWKLLFDDAGEAPDPRHHDTISISTANIPAFQDSFHNMWRETPLLPDLDEMQLQTVSTLLEKLLRMAPIMQRYRHQNTQPRTPRTPATAPNMLAVAHAVGPSPSPSSSSYMAPPQEQSFEWNPDTYLNIDNADNSSSQGYPGTESLTYNSSASTSFGQDYGGTANLPYGQNT